MTNFITRFKKDYVYLEIFGDNSDTNQYFVEFIDLNTGNVEYSNTLSVNYWAKLDNILNKNIEIKVKSNSNIIFQKNEKFRKFWTESLIRLNEIMPLTDEKSVLLKADINRQLGLFQNSIDLLKGIENPLASQISEYALKGITEVFKS